VIQSLVSLLDYIGSHCEDDVIFNDHITDSDLSIPSDKKEIR
jgi:hypothetical protein